MISFVIPEIARLVWSWADLQTNPSVIKDAVCRKIAFVIPRSIVYWCLIRAWAHATQGVYSNTVVGELYVQEVINRWE